ncbi:MAG: FKBP-type peptidyl-prolyl cis-trans isomerase [Chlorobi bacterium]|nr:FKBP-type peptidyl-prolyl cis-trans isomerase [Chlorobiota bacterium]
MKIKTVLIIIPVVFLTLASCNQPVGEKKLKTHIDTISYCIGVVYGGNLHRDGFDTINAELIGQGLNDYVNKGKTLIDKDKAKKILLEQYRIVKEKELLDKYGDNKTDGEKFLEENAKRKEVTVLPSGLQYEILETGHGEQPDSNDLVYVHYRGQLVNGTVFEENFGKDPVIFAPNRVIPGWTEALLHMHAGDRWKIFIPYQLGYGTEFRPNSPIEPYSALIFEIELVKVKREP